jgi:hypothetical protein
MRTQTSTFNENPHMKNAKKYLEKAIAELTAETEYQTKYILSSVKKCVSDIDNQIFTYMERCYQAGENVKF